MQVTVDSILDAKLGAVFDPKCLVEALLNLIRKQKYPQS